MMLNIIVLSHCVSLFFQTIRKASKPRFNFCAFNGPLHTPSPKPSVTTAPNSPPPQGHKVIHFQVCYVVQVGQRKNHTHPPNSDPVLVLPSYKRCTLCKSPQTRLKDICAFVQGTSPTIIQCEKQGPVQV